jgi:hypothetical protein
MSQDNPAARHAYTPLNVIAATRYSGFFELLISYNKLINGRG